MGSAESRARPKNRAEEGPIGGRLRRRFAATVLAVVALVAVVFAALRPSRIVPTAELVVADPDFIVHAPSLSVLCRSLEVEPCTSAARSSSFASAITELSGIPAASLAQIETIRSAVAGKDRAASRFLDVGALLDGEWIVSGTWSTTTRPKPPQKLFGTPDLRAPFPYERILIAVRPTHRKSLALIAEILDPTLFARTVRDRIDPTLSIANYDGILVLGNPSIQNAESSSPYHDPPAIAASVVGDCVVFGTVADVVAKRREETATDRSVEDWLANSRGAVASARVESAFFERAAAGARFFFGDSTAAVARRLTSGSGRTTSISWSAADRLEFTIDAPWAPSFTPSRAPCRSKSGAAWATLSLGAPPREVLKAMASVIVHRDDDERFVDALTTEEASSVVTPTADDVDRAVVAATPRAADGVVVEFLAPENIDATSSKSPLDAHVSDVRLLYPISHDASWPPASPPPFEFAATLDGDEKFVSIGGADGKNGSRAPLGFLVRHGDLAAISSRGGVPPPEPFEPPSDDDWARLSIDGERLASYLRTTDSARRRDDVTFSAKEMQDLRDAARRHLIETAKRSSPTTEEIDNLVGTWKTTLIASEREPRADRRRRILDFLAEWAPNLEATARMIDGHCRIVFSISARKGSIN